MAKHALAHPETATLRLAHCEQLKVEVYPDHWILIGRGGREFAMSELETGLLQPSSGMAELSATSVLNQSPRKKPITGRSVQPGGGQRSPTAFVIFSRAAALPGWTIGHFYLAWMVARACGTRPMVTKTVPGRAHPLGEREVGPCAYLRAHLDMAHMNEAGERPNYLSLLEEA